MQAFVATVYNHVRRELRPSKIAETLPRREQRLLEGVLCVLDRAEHPVAMGVELSAMHRHQALEGGLVALPDGSQEPLVGATAWLDPGPAKEDGFMRFAIVVKANEGSEAGILPGEDALRETVEYHEELQKAGILYDAMGLRPTREGWRIRYSGDARTVVNGPFAQAGDQVAGWTIIHVGSREEAMGWAMRFPWPTHDRAVDGEIEVRQVFEFEDFVQGPAIARFRRLETIDKIAIDVERARPDLTSVAAPNGTATILFTDIEGSTQLNEDLGDAGWMSLLREHNEIVRTHSALHSGFEVKSQGDGFMLAFPSARDALRCAVEIQRSLAERDREGPQLRVRIGLHTGEPVREADDFYGKAVNLAARIAAEARGSEILVSSLVRDLVESSGEFAFEDPTDAELKGLSGMYRLSAVPLEAMITLPTWSVGA